MIDKLWMSFGPFRAINGAYGQSGRTSFGNLKGLWSFVTSDDVGVKLDQSINW